jgi:hypothetical protein
MSDTGEALGTLFARLVSVGPAAQRRFDAAHAADMERLRHAIGAAGFPAAAEPAGILPARQVLDTIGIDIAAELDSRTGGEASLGLGLGARPLTQFAATRFAKRHGARHRLTVTVSQAPAEGEETTDERT